MLNTSASKIHCKLLGIERDISPFRLLTFIDKCFFDRWVYLLLTTWISIFVAFRSDLESFTFCCNHASVTVKPVRPVRPVEPVEPVERVEPVEPVVIQKGSFQIHPMSPPSVPKCSLNPPQVSLPSVPKCYPKDLILWCSKWSTFLVL